MAAPGEAREDSFCARCYAHVASDAPYCPECGAPTGDVTIAAESAGHSELAQANLLRLRGDLEGSEKTLLTLLRRFPNDPHAHEMLGDVCVERDELDRAIEWYELAQDLSPNSADIRRKLDETRECQEGREMADTAETLGLPTAKPNVATWWPLAASAAILILAIMIVAWPRSAPPAPLKATIVANGPVETTASRNNTPSTTPMVTPETPPASTPTTGTEDDRKLLEALQGRAGSVRVQTVTLDPRTQTLAVTFEVGATDDPKAVAIALGKEALGVAPSAMTASLRAVHADRLVFAADLARSAMANADPLANIWPTPTTSEPTTPPTTTTSTTSGTTEPPETTEPPTGSTAGMSSPVNPPATTGSTTSG